jgi:asparagine synthase (glutamine-hydrolysing)
MNAAQKHRGPDDHGVVQSGHVVLGNTRLAIIDTTSAGHQPMTDPETGNCITYNGETYNFRELRRELGGEWFSNTDTEVVLRAYARWGVNAFRKLRGMFALAIWDHARQTLMLARDSLGIKPLYYYRDKDYFVFASELRALLASELVPRRLSTAGIDSYLATGSVQSPLTMVEGVRQLLPGHCLFVRQTEVSEAEFTSPPAQEEIRSRDEAVARLRAELEESIRLHLLSDVPLGVFLSGGMDSSAFVALMSKLSENKPKTFSVVFDEENFTEAPFSRAVAERFQTDHHEIRLSEDRLLALLPAAIAAIDQPTMDGINTFVVSQAVKNAGITVALSGLGGDELFAGYPSFRRALKVQSISPTTKRVLRAASGFGKVALNGSVQRHKFWQAAKSDCAPADVYRISRQLFATEFVMKLTGRDTMIRSSNGHHHDSDVVNTISRLELKGYMTNTLLRDTDAMSMAHSLEVRVPFVDTRVVDYVLSLPGEWKLSQKTPGPKSLLADALSDLLPRDFLTRPKMGFTLPFEKWLRQNLRNEIGSVLKDARRLSACGINSEAAQKVWGNFLQNPRAVGWSRPWALFVLVRWCEINGFV